MPEMTNQAKGYVAYEYKRVIADEQSRSMLIDSYECFGWSLDDNAPPSVMQSYQKGKWKPRIVLNFKRDRRLVNKVELTRLERHFESCMWEIDKMQKSAYSMATMISIIIGILGTVFMAGVVFSATASSPMIALSIFLAVPALAGWIGAPLSYQYLLKKQLQRIAPLVEEKQKEIYEICEKGSRFGS